MNKELTIRRSFMTERRKQGLIILAISIPVLCYGAFSFELGGASSNFEAITVAIAVALGLFGVGSGLLMLFTKTRLGWIESKEPKPIIKEEKEMSEIKDGMEKPVEKSSDDITEEVTEEVAPSESIYLMKREKVLVDRIEELNGFLNETETKLSQVRENLETKGWVNSDNGWVIE
jgi:hypothetical protein